MSTARLTLIKADQPEPENHADLSKLVPLGELLKQIPTASLGTPNSTVSARRWIMDGVQARDGSKIRLWALKTPRCWVSSQAALLAFFEAQTADRIAARTSGAQPRRKAAAAV